MAEVRVRMSHAISLSSDDERIAGGMLSNTCDLPKHNLFVQHANPIVAVKTLIFNTLSREYWLAGYWYSQLLLSSEIAFTPIVRAKTIDEYYVTIPVSRVRMTSLINCGDVTMLRPPLATVAK